MGYRLKSKEAGLLRTQVFRDRVKESFSVNIDDAIRKHFPKYKTGADLQGDIVIVTIEDKHGNKKEILHWMDNADYAVPGGITETAEEKQQISNAIQGMAKDSIFPSIKDGLKKTKEYYGVSD